MRSIISFIMCFALAAPGVMPSRARAAEPARVLIIPFDVNAQQRFDFLSEGTYDMLSTRMAIADKTVLVDRRELEEQLVTITGPIDEAQALRIASELQATYLLYGSLTLFGDTVSTDARFIDVGLQKSLVVFSQTGSDHGDIIDHLDLFSDQVKQQVFGLQPTTVQRAKPAATTTVTVKPTEQGSAPAAKGSQAGAIAIVVEQPDRPPVATNRSKRFKERIVGITSADIDGKPGQEIVFVSKNKGSVYQVVEGTFRKIGGFKGKSGQAFIAVDAADINGNGRAEIFVTSLYGVDSNQTLRSFVLEWNGSRFDTLVEKSNWYYRVIDMPARGKILVGQERGRSSIFKAGIFELNWSNGTYNPAQELTLPGGMNIFGFAYGDALNDGRNMLLTFNRRHRIQIYDDLGKKVYSGKDPLGGTPAYILHPAANQSGSNDATAVRVRSRTYLRQRLFVTDLDGDGINEVVTTANRELAGNYLERLKTYKEGRIHFLVWGGAELQSRLKTQEFDGYISDFTIADLDGDGLGEIAFSVVIKTGSMVGTTPKSVIYTLDLNSPQSG